MPSHTAYTVTPTTPRWRWEKKHLNRTNIPTKTIMTIHTDTATMRTITVITTMPVINTTIVPTTNRC